MALFSEVFGVDPMIMEKYGAFDISLSSDLPLFIDPFLLFDSQDNKTRKIIGELDPFGPDYLSFFIETHHQILSSKNKHRNDLFRFHILLEEYLSSYANDRIPVDQPLTLKLDELRAIDFKQTTLPPQRIQWMNRNYGFTATRDAIV